VVKQARTTAAIFVLSVIAFGAAPKELKPGWNLFSKEQDVQLGREAAAQVERQMPVVRDSELNSYVQQIGRKLAAAPEAAGFPYSFKVINDKSINAFALPGGPTYVHTGLIRAVENEAQLAGVMAHEIAHVALRHGTHQASKANAVQLPAMILGGILGQSGSMLGQLAQLGVGLGANSVLLKFSRDAESDADRLGARIMARAGYNPLEMARFFEKLQAQGGGGGPQFLSDHPNPGNRVKIVQEEIAFMPRRDFTETGSGELKSMQGRLGSLPAASGTRGRTGETVGQGDPRPSGNFRQYNGNGFSISHPDNWEVFGGDGGSTTIAPRSGLVQDTGGGVAVGYGMIASYANVYHDNDLRNATADLVGQLRQSNPAIQVSGRQQSTRVNGQNALVTTLYNQSPMSGREVDMLVTVQGRDRLFYMVFIAPEAEYRNMQPVYEQMLRSVRLR
jgi:beta-barrel assembly-enhancing protease